MKIAQNIKAISKLLFILLLLLALIVGAIFSYLLVVGYYITLEAEVPEKTTISVKAVHFNPQDVGTFNITILNPSYSPTAASITEISVATQDNIVHKISNVNPQLPFELQKGQDETFRCQWNWGNFSGENVKVIVLVEDGSGSAYEITTSPVRLTITTMGFNPADTEHFNMTVKNALESLIDLNFEDIIITLDDGAVVEVSETNPALPQLLRRDTYNTFTVSWDWSDYRGGNVTVTALTSEGYTANRTQSTPKPVLLSVTELNVDSDNTTYFNVTVSNSEYSTIPANLTQIKVNLEDQTSVEVAVESPPDLPFTLSIGETVTFKCLWDWTDRQGEGVIVVVETSEGYFGQSTIYAIG
ncbi:MAG: hypothetical protein JSW14_02815 [Candidatus Bathyarchaeum sp.]|nr:MAG: hypothetical protein JSW14_02815 [Candidatus Bathyarchaeum sp.]